MEAQTVYKLTDGIETPAIGRLANLFDNSSRLNLDSLLKQLFIQAGKTSFLVFRKNKYTTIATESIAFFYIKYEGTIMTCFDHQEYSVNYSLDEIENLVTGKLFYRLNRQYLINFKAIKEVEHYFARKLLVNLSLPTAEKLLVSKEKARSFFLWLENR